MVEYDYSGSSVKDYQIINVMHIETSISGADINEPAIDSLNNIVKDMLPPGGYPYQNAWTKGMSQTLNLIWDLNKLNEENVIYDKSKLGIVVFVQNNVNEGTREVYQAAYANLPELEESPVITGIEEELNIQKFEDATIYPNPAQYYFNVSLSDQLTMNLDWIIIDQRGVELMNGTFEAGEDSFEIDAKTLPVGLHMFIVTSGTEYKTIRKIIIQR